MDGPFLRILGVGISAPMAAGTNLLLAVLAGLFHLRLRRADSAEPRFWSQFFLFIALATLFGVPKHAFMHHSGATLHTVVVLASNLAAGLGTYFAERAVLTGCRDRGRGRWLLAARVKLGLFAALVLWLHSFGLVVANVFLGLGAVLAVEARRARHGSTASRLRAVGLALGVLPAAAFLLGVSLGPWLGPIDLAHVLMAPCLLLVYLGTRSGARGAPERAREEEPQAFRLEGGSGGRGGT